MLFQIYPGDNVIVQYGDKLGFQTEVSVSGIVYDWKPMGNGSTIRTLLLSHDYPKKGDGYMFDAVAYDTWAFSISAKVDTG